MVWDFCFANRVAAFRLCILTRGRRRNGTDWRTHDIYRGPLPASVLCSRRRGGNELWALLNWDAYGRDLGALCERHLLRLVASEMPAHRFGSVIKQAALTSVLVLLIAFLLISCTSTTDETLSSPASSQSGAAVPGEKMPDDQRYAPGPMGSSSVHW
jgi:hypothetical protein